MDRLPLGFYLPAVGTLFNASSSPAQQLRDIAHAAVRHGLTSAWVVDHLLPAPRLYTDAWLEAFQTLSCIADVGELDLGTGVLVLPLRNPIGVARAVASLQQLSGRRLRLGVGTGWDVKEFEAVGRSLADRGALTDEAMDIIDLMFSGGGSYAGRFNQFVDIDPGALGQPPEVWVGGGGQLAHANSVERPRLARSVAKRILRTKRWAIRPTASIENAENDREDLHKVASEMEMSIADLRIVHFNFLHLVETADPQKARLEQMEQFYRVMSRQRGPEYFEGCYMIGTIDEVRSRIMAWRDFGVQELILHPFQNAVEQFDLWAKYLGDLCSIS